MEWKPTAEMLQDFIPLFENEMDRYWTLMEETDGDSLILEMWEGWLNGDEEAERMQHEMDKMIYAPGGPWDQAAGDDGVMVYDEFRAYIEAMHAQMEEMLGESFPRYSDEEIDAIYEAYDNLSEGDGYTKLDSMTGKAIFNKIRDHRITDDEMWRYYTMGEMWFDKITDVDNEEW